MMCLIQLLKRLRIQRRSHVISPGVFLHGTTAGQVQLRLEIEEVVSHWPTGLSVTPKGELCGQCVPRAAHCRIKW